MLDLALGVNDVQTHLAVHGQQRLIDHHFPSSNNVSKPVVYLGVESKVLTPETRQYTALCTPSSLFLP